MAGLLDSLRSTIGRPGKRVYDTETKLPPFSGLSLKQKLERIVRDKRLQGRDQRQRNRSVWYLMALYYRGYQHLELNASGDSFDVYEREDYYVENQFRKHVDHVKQLLNKMEGDVVVRPASNSPIDLATARVADPVLTSQLDEIGYETVLDMKNLYKALFGNAFIFTDYIQNKKYGSIVTPKYSYEERPGPDGEAMLSKVVTGYATENKGKQICTVCSPLEINVSPDIRPFTETPYIQWISRQDIDLLNYIYPGLNIMSGDSSADDGMQYLETLGNLQGNVSGDSITDSGNDALRQKAELVRTWLQPCEFRGDKELEKEFTDGAHITTVNGKCVEYYPEALQDRWTHEVLIPVPHALLGDGLYDAVLMQDQINEINSLLIQHTRYSTVGRTYYNSSAFSASKDIVNDPAHAFVPVAVPLEGRISDTFAQSGPNALSQDVPAWLATVKQAMQDMTSAYDPATGKGLGANTPYSQSVFLTERAQSRWQGSLSYNRPEMIRFRRQLLEDAKRRDSIRVSMTDNIGQWSFEQYTAADLQGSVDILLSNTDFKPKSRAEQVQGLQMLTTLAQIIPSLPPKQKLAVEEIMGLPPDANPMSGQISRAYRMIDRIKKGEAIAPLPLVDDPQAQVPVFADFLSSEEGEALAESDPETFANVYTYMATLLNMGVMQMSSPGGQMAMQIQGKGQAPPEEGTAPTGQPGKPPGGQPGQKGGGPGSANQPNAQSPAQPAPPVSAPSA